MLVALGNSPDVFKTQAKPCGLRHVNDVGNEPGAAAVCIKVLYGGVLMHAHDEPCVSVRSAPELCGAGGQCAGPQPAGAGE